MLEFVLVFLQAIRIAAAKSERGIMPEQLALKLLLSFRGLYKG